MEPLIVNNLFIIDDNLKKAAFLQFEKGINVVTSDLTSRGKSSALRAIAYSLGAEANYDSIFVPSNKYFQISFDYGRNTYKIIRFSRKFIVVKNNSIEEAFSGEIDRLSVFFEKEFGFSIYLTSREGKYEIAPPGYSLIPYFLDQDSSWKGKDTNPFKMAWQYVNDLNDIYFYHTGIIDAEYGRIKNDVLVKSDKSKALNTKIEGLEKNICALKEYFETNKVSISKEDAELNLKILKRSLDNLLGKQHEIQDLIFEKENLISKYNIEIETMTKLKKDIDEGTNGSNRTICPNCGYEFSLEQFYYNKALIDDNVAFAEHMIESLEQETRPLRDELDSVCEEINKTTNYYKNNEKDFETFLKLQSVSILLEKLEKEYLDICKQREQNTNSINEENTLLEKYEAKKTEAKSNFKDIYLENLKKLKITNVARNVIVPYQKVKISGNKYVRSTLAFFLSILELKRLQKFNNFNLPIIVDSPFEGDPDEINKADVIEIIKDYYLKNRIGSQLFIGLREAKKYFNEDESVHYIELKTDEDSLLDSETYLSRIKEVERVREIISKIE